MKTKYPKGYRSKDLTDRRAEMPSVPEQPPAKSLKEALRRSVVNSKAHEYFDTEAARMQKNKAAVKGRLSPRLQDLFNAHEDKRIRENYGPRSKKNIMGRYDKLKGS